MYAQDGILKSVGAHIEEAARQITPTVSDKIHRKALTQITVSTIRDNPSVIC